MAEEQNLNAENQDSKEKTKDDKIEKDIPQSINISGETKIERGMFGGDKNIQYNIQNIYEDSSKKDDKELEKIKSFKIEKYLYQKEGLEKIRKTFVKSKSFEELKSQIKNKLVILKGEEGAGKLTAALYLGITLKDESIIDNIYIISDSEEISPNSFFNKLPAKSYVVIEDAFEEANTSFATKIFGKGDHARITHIRNSLNESYMVVVSNINLQNFSAKIIQDLFDTGVLIKNFIRPNSNEVFQKYFSYFLNEEMRNKTNEILNDSTMRESLRDLDTPQKIEKFVEYALMKVDLKEDVDTLRKNLKKEINNLINIQSEVEKYYEELTDECKSLAITLSLFHGVSESDLWQAHNFITPKQDESNGKEDDGKIKYKSPFATSKNKLLKEIRASINKKRVKIYEEDSSIIDETITTEVKFDDERYPNIILPYVLSNYPDYISEIINILIESLTPPPENLIQRIAIANALGILGSANWSTIKKLSELYALHDFPSFRAITGHIFETAVQNERINADVINTLMIWSNLRANPNNWKLIWTAASSFKQIGQFNIKLALLGLKKIISKVEVQNQEDYNVEILNAVSYSIIVLAIKGYLAQIIEELHNCIKESKSDNNDSVIIIISMIWHHLAGVFYDFAKETESQNEILTVVSGDDHLLDSFSYILSSIFLKLHPMKLNGKPLSGVFFTIAKDWVITSDDDHKKTAIKIIRKISANIKNSNKKYYQYFTSYLKKNWCANKQENAVKSAAKLILKT